MVGLKQTYGLVSRDGIYPLSEDFDHGGPLGKTVADVATVLQIIAGEDPEDPSTRLAVVSDYGAALGGDLKGVRVGIPKNYFFDDLDPEVESTVVAALTILEDLGALITPISIPFADQATEAWTVMAMAESYQVHQSHIKSSATLLSPDVRSRLLLGRDISTQSLIQARWARTDVNRQMTQLLERVDLLAMPTSPIPAVRVVDGALEVAGKSVEGPKVLGRLTRLAAFTGQPAISVPCGFTGDGMPVGLQLMGGWFDEARLLAAAHAYEQATDWHRHRAPAA